MSYLHFDRTQMANLQDSLMKELLITNRAGAYCFTTLTGCNIRKYHGLFVVPLPEIDDENHVLLSSLDETVVQHGAEFNLGLHKYAGDNFAPKGHKYILSFEWDKVPTWIYRIGGVLLRKEMAYDMGAHRLYIRYTLLEAHSKTTLRLKPFLAFRSVRAWTHENGQADMGYRDVKGGIAMRLYAGYPELFMQTSRAAEWHHQPDWYRGLDYPKERERGYEATEDLVVPGYFEMTLEKGKPIVFCASLEEAAPRALGGLMEKNMDALDTRDNFYQCLVNAAHQFGVHRDGEHYLLSGWPWFKCRARDMLISLPGLTFSIGEPERFERYWTTMGKALRDFIERRPVSVAVHEVEQPDTLLWAVWSLQQYGKNVSKKACRERYGSLVGDMMDFIRSGKHPNLFLHDNGLLYANGTETAITWMNATAGGRPIVPRSGYIVEFNALWYNAIMFYRQMLEETGTKESLAEAAKWTELGEKVQQSFKDTFLNEHGYLLDYVNGQMMDWSVRPNQIFAIALDYSPLSIRERKGVLDICTKELVTPKGLRSLSPKSGGYNPLYIGRQEQRDYAYHNGTAWPWLMGFYLEAYIKVYKMSGINFIERKLIGFEEELFYHCVGTIPELFDGNPRFSGRGAVSFAMNVGGILRAIRLLEKITHELEAAD